jgi:hypothetical protein
MRLRREFHGTEHRRHVLPTFLGVLGVIMFAISIAIYGF